MLALGCSSASMKQKQIGLWLSWIGLMVILLSWAGILGVLIGWCGFAVVIAGGALAFPKRREHSLDHVPCDRLGSHKAKRER